MPNDGRGSDGAPAPPSQVKPDRIFELATGFMAAKHLFVASELGLFEALADGPVSIDELSARTRVPPRGTRISADALVALGLLERDGDAYRNSALAATFLAGQTPADLRPCLRFWHSISYPAWSRLADALRASPRPIPQLDQTAQAIFSDGIESITAGAAASLATAYDFSPHLRLLDLAGGTGSWSAAVTSRHPHMRATVFDVPGVVSIARDRLAARGLGERVAVAAGDVMSGELPSGHDVILLANIIHYFTPAKNGALLRRVRASVPAGCRLLLADLWTDPTHTDPPMAALLAGEFAVNFDGDVYSVDEVRSWLEPAGWQFVEHAGLTGPMSLIVAEAV